jgi:hypothetical protein
MDVFFTELEIWLSFFKTSEFTWGGEGVEPSNPPPDRYASDVFHNSVRTSKFVAVNSFPRGSYCNGALEFLPKNGCLMYKLDLLT